MVVAGAVAPLMIAASYGCGEDSSGSTTKSSSTSQGASGPAAGGGGAGGNPTTTNGGGGAGATGGAGGGGTGGDGGAGGVVMTSADCTPPTGMAGMLQLTPVHTNLDFPMMVTYAPGDSSRLYIVERDGRILLSVNGATPTEFADIGNAPNWSVGNEGGLLGLAFHNDYANNGRFFVHYTADGGGSGFRNVIQEHRRDPNDMNLADPMPTHPPTLEIDQQATNHNGGSIHFSPVDGYLYIAIGDGGPQNDPEHDAVSRTMNLPPDMNDPPVPTLLGKILRIDVAATDGSYAIPSGNAPGTLPGQTDEIFDWGLRNPFRFAFDPCTGDRYIGDVGQASFEEIDVALASQGPTNWGWNCFEGFNMFNPPSGSMCPYGDETPPAIDYSHANNNRSVTGGVVYRNSGIPWLRGTYFYGDWASGRVWSFRYENGMAMGNAEIFNLGENVPGFGNDNDGNVYVTETDVNNGNNGTVYRIDEQ